MRVRAVGDHSVYHGGCRAVWEVLTNALSANGGRIVGDDSDYDVLVVNGEGNMHHGSAGCRRKIAAIEAALREGRAAYLVNTVWQENPPDFDDLLKRCASISVREIMSRDELAERHGVQSTICLDYSYFAPAPEDERGADFRGEEAETDYFSAEHGDFRPFPESAAYGGRAPFSLKDGRWPRLVASLRTASLLVTGRQHAVYAACRARTPFAAIEGNTHKIRGLIKTSGIDIPVAEKPEELPAIIDFARANGDRYQRLFDWMDEEAARTPPTSVLPRAS